MHSARPSRWFATLRFRLTFWNTVVILLLVSGTMPGVRQALEFALRREQDQLLRDDAHEVALAVEQFQPDWAALSDYLDRKARSHQDRAWFGQVFARDGRMLAASPKAPVDEELVLLEPGRPYDACLSRRVQRRTTQAKGETLIVCVGSSREFVSEDVDRLTHLLVIVGAVVVLVVPLTGWWLAGRATRPLA